MAAIINTNLQSMNAQRNLSKSQATLSTAMQRLSSGLRINSAKDDAAGLAISERMTTQTRGLTVAARNANDGISLAQTAEGALGSITSNLQRIRELAVQARNATNNADDRAALNEEVQQLMEEVNRIARDTTFNGTNLLDGSFTNMAFQVGANQSQTIDVTSIVNANTNALGSWTSVNTPSTVLAMKPEGSTGLAAPGLATTSFTLGAAATTVGFNVGGTDITSDAFTAPGTPATIKAALEGTTGWPADVEVEITGDTTNGFQVAIKNESATDVSLKIGGSTAVTVPAQITGDGFLPFSLEVNGATISVAAANTPEQRVNQLAQAINSASTADPAVMAKVVDGQLKVYSEVGEVEIAAVAPFDGDDLKAQTGLTEGTTDPAGTQFGAGVTATALIAGKSEAGFDLLNVLDEYAADNAIRAMDGALAAVNSARATLGAVQSRFESTIENLNIANENLTASKSRIMDADFAAETARLSSAQVLQQAGTAMVAQANQIPQGVLQLLQG